MASTYSPDRALTDSTSHTSEQRPTTRILMTELLFADDSALFAHSAEEMQKIVNVFSDASRKFESKYVSKIKQNNINSNRHIRH